MKVKGLGKVLILGLVLTSLASCKEEEFYEKEFIDSLSDQYERENLPDELVENPDELPEDIEPPVIVPPNVEPPTTEPVPSVEPTPPVIIPPVEPAPPVEPTPPVIIPPVEPAPPVEPTPPVIIPPVEPAPPVITPPVEPAPPVITPPVDPAPPVGPTPPVITPPVEPAPPVEPTPPVITPPVEPAPPVEPTPPVIDDKFEEISDVFNQNANGGKLDILWVIDNSGSMAGEQRDLGDNFDAFIKEFVNKGIDFKMAVTTTDTNRDNAGKVYKDSMVKLTSKKLAEDLPQFMDDFAELVKVGTRGSAREKGLQASEVFSDRYGKSWMRPDAYFTIVYLSDEKDQSSKSVEKHLKQIQKWKDNNGLIRAYSIVNMGTSRWSRGSNYARYKEMSDLTGGTVASIHSDFHNTLLDMGENIASLTEQFPLSKVPYDVSELVITVNGVVSQDWSYDGDSNTIKFDAASIPVMGAKINVEYRVKK